MDRILLVHPDRLFRDALATALAGEEGIVIAGSAPSVDRLRLDPGEGVPDVVVLDLGLPERTGLAAARAVRSALPGVRVLMTGCSELESDIVASLEAGAAGYVPAGASLDDLVRNLRAVARGAAHCSPEVTGLLISRLAEYSSHRERLHEMPPVRLTPRELEIVALLDDGLSNKEIAARLRIELQTVKNHVHNILEKLRVPRREEAVRFARKRGLLGPAWASPRCSGAAAVQGY